MPKAPLQAAPVKRSRDAVSGKFDSRGPLNDRRLLVHVTEVIRACDTLSPVLLALSSSDDERRPLMDAALVALALVRTSYEFQLYPSEIAQQEEINPERLLATLRKNWEPLFKGKGLLVSSLKLAGGKK